MIETEQRVAQIKQREQKTVDGPWVHSLQYGHLRFVLTSLNGIVCSTREAVHFEAEFEFIAHARSDIPWLLEQLEQMTKIAHMNSEYARAYELEAVAERGKSKKLRDVLKEWHAEYLRMMSEDREVGYSEFCCKAGVVADTFRVLTETEE